MLFNNGSNYTATVVKPHTSLM